MQLIDIGVNLTDSSFNNDRDSVIQRAMAAGVGQMVITGTTIEESDKAIALCRSHNGQRLFCTAGLHPHQASRWNKDTEQKLRYLLAQPEVRAIGECGLDFNRDFSPRDQQEKALEKQLALADELQLPLFLHERDAASKLLEILKSCGQSLPRAVVHCFTGDKESLHAYLDRGLYIGITGWICDERRGAHLLELVRDIPRGRLMLETDAPYLLPRTLQPRPRNRRNEPAYLAEVLNITAKARGETPQQLAEHTSACARQFFQLPEMKPIDSH